eukprot:m.113478 g.113478  ORF g.113478 m.113478 type:complete len:1536 (+) comp10803_c0_seq1:348-4955(+)
MSGPVHKSMSDGDTCGGDSGPSRAPSIESTPDTDHSGAYSDNNILMHCASVDNVTMQRLVYQSNSVRRSDAVGSGGAIRLMTESSEGVQHEYIASAGGNGDGGMFRIHQRRDEEGSGSSPLNHRTPSRWNNVRTTFRKRSDRRKMENVIHALKRKEPVHCYALKLQQPVAVIKALRKAVLPDNHFELLNAQNFATGDGATMDKFLTADLLVVDYGKDWEVHAEVGFRVGQRHSTMSDDVTTKLKHSIQLIETVEEELNSFTFSDFSFEASNSYRVPYVYADGEVRVYIANSLFTQRGAGDAAAADAAHDGQGQDGAAADAAVGRPQGEVTRSLRPAGEFFNLIIKQISNVKNRRSYPWDRSNNVTLQRQFERRVVPTTDKQLTNDKRKEQLLRAVGQLREHASLRTEANVLLLLRHLRDIKAWNEMIEVLEIKNSEGQPLSALSDSTADIAHYEAVAFYGRGMNLGEVEGKADQERAHALINKVCERFPKNREAQGFKGKVFKALFSRAIQREGILDHEEIAKYHKSAVDAYNMLRQLERAEDPNNVPVWSTSNLSILLFTAPNWTKYRMDIWDYIEEVNIRLKPRDIWDSNTLFLINVVGAFLFEYDKYFEMANNVVGILLSLRYENWMLESMLTDLHLINTVYMRRKVERKNSIARARFHFWVDFLEQSVAHDTDPTRRKFPVLVSSNASLGGADDLGAMQKMSISVENHVSSYTHGGRPPSTGSGDRTSLLGRNSSSSTGLDIRRSSWRSTTMPSMRSVSGSQLDDVLGSPEIGRDSTLTRSPRAESPMSDRKQRKESNIENVKIQISPHVPEEGGSRQVVTPIHLAEIQYADIPRPGGQGGVDERRLIISFASVADGSYGGALSYTVMFPSSKLREQFMKVCNDNGYEDRSKAGETADTCPPWRFKSRPSEEGSKILLGEGSYAHVFAGEIMGPAYPDDEEDVVAHCAVKQIKEGWLSAPHVVADFQSEVHKIRQLKHKNIIEFIGLWQGPDDAIARTYLMEVLDGSLYTLLDMVGGLYNPNVRDESTAAIVSYTAQMINAVNYLHTQHKFCHRDIKPANFLIRCSDGVIKLSDFGTAKDVSGFDKYATEVVGSFQYMDPKVLQGGEYGLETDIYCLGSTVWELVTGKHPYHGATSVKQLIQARQHADATLPIDEEWPDVIREFLESCFSDPKLRPTSEALMEGDLVEDAVVILEREPPGLWDGDRVMTIRSEAAQAMRDCMEQLKAEWQHTVEISNAKKGDDDDSIEGSGAARAPVHAQKRDFDVLLPKIVEMLEDSYGKNMDINDGTYADLSAVSQELLGMSGSAPLTLDARFARALDVVNILSKLKIPSVPATLDDSAASRGNVHFVLKILWATPFFARYPHIMWVFRDLLNQTVEEMIREFVPLSTLNRSSRARADTVSSGSRNVSRVQSDADRVGTPVGSRTAPTDLTEVMAKLDDVLRTVQQIAASRNSSSVVSADEDASVEVDPGMISYLERKEVPQPVRHAITLTQACITPHQLQDNKFTRDDLRSIGLPLGIVARLVPKDGK